MNETPRPFGHPRRLRRQPLLGAALSVAVGASALALAGATAATATAASRGGRLHAPRAATSLVGVCPNPLVIQTSWYPELEKSAVYALVGPNGKYDTAHGYYYGKVGGITVQVAAGGPFQGNESDIGELYAHPNVFMAEANTDDQYTNFAQHPTVAVLAPLQKSPLGIIWDPKVYHFSSLKQIAASGAQVLKAGQDASSDLLTVNGTVKASQWDFTYDGAPGRFVASGGKLLVDDYVTQAPYNYEHFSAWHGGKLSYLLLASAGYASYENSLVVTPKTLATRATCLKRLVPMIQAAEIAFVKDPTPLSNALIKYADAIKSQTPLSTGLDSFTVATMKSLGILANGTNGVYGSFNLARVQSFIGSLAPVAKLENTPVPKGLKASELVTNRFLDPSLHLP